ncbi:RHO1 GDP-GTP exchange protein 2 [Blyttiomyces sp. JEL0837]|nr:RHO1 GDP-GTP exchange protein 2 [Blyttiomyces sp. JEL0837]
MSMMYGGGAPPPSGYYPYGNPQGYPQQQHHQQQQPYSQQQQAQQGQQHGQHQHQHQPYPSPQQISPPPLYTSPSSEGRRSPAPYDPTYQNAARPPPPPQMPYYGQYQQPPYGAYQQPMASYAAYPQQYPQQYYQQPRPGPAPPPPPPLGQYQQPLAGPGFPPFNMTVAGYPQYPQQQTQMHQPYPQPPPLQPQQQQQPLHQPQPQHQQHLSHSPPSGGYGQRTSNGSSNFQLSPGGGLSAGGPPPITISGSNQGQNRAGSGHGHLSTSPSKISATTPQSQSPVPSPSHQEHQYQNLQHHAQSTPVTALAPPPPLPPRSPNPPSINVDTSSNPTSSTNPGVNRHVTAPNQMVRPQPSGNSPPSTTPKIIRAATSPSAALLDATASLSISGGDAGSPLSPPRIAPTESWDSHISEEVMARLSDKEKKRQRNIFEIITLQINFTNDLETVKRIYHEPLQQGDILDANRQSEFIWDIFGPFDDLLQVNRNLLQVMLDRQTGSDYVIESIGDLFTDFIQDFGIYEYYGENVTVSVRLLNEETKKNPRLKAFFDQTLRSGSKVKELKDYLTSLIKRFTDYGLNLKDVLKNTAPDNPDAKVVESVMASLGEIGKRMNESADRIGRKLRMQYIQRRMAPQDKVATLNLLLPEREEVFSQSLIVKRQQDQHIHLFMFDHCLVMAKTKDNQTKDDDDGDSSAPSNKNSYFYLIYKEPMPLDLIQVSATNPLEGASVSRHTTITTAFNPNAGANTATDIAKKSFFVEDRRPGGQSVVYHFVTQNPISAESWVKKIKERQRLRLTKAPLTLLSLVDVNLPTEPKVVASAMFNGDMLLLATSKGLLLGGKGSAFRRSGGFSTVLSLPEISHLEVMEDLDLALVLTERSVVALSLRELVSGMLHSAPLANARKVSDNAAYFKIGTCDGKRLVCSVGPSALGRWEIRLLDPTKEKKKNMFSKGREMEVFKEFVIPTRVTSINFLKSRVVLGVTKGFEMVHLSLVGAAANAPLLDQTDPLLYFVLKREDLVPISLFRTKDNYLLCFQDMGFFVTSNGRRDRPEYLLQWRGVPTSFAFIEPYIVGISNNLIEVYDITTCEMVQAIPGSNMKALQVVGDAVYLVKDGTEGLALFRIQLK